MKFRHDSLCKQRTSITTAITRTIITVQLANDESVRCYAISIVIKRNVAQRRTLHFKLHAATDNLHRTYRNNTEFQKQSSHEAIAHSAHIFTDGESVLFVKNYRIMTEEWSCYTLQSTDC